MERIQIPKGSICGRIIRGKAEKDFETLSDDKMRRVVMLMAGDGLEMIGDKTTQQAFPIIGYNPDWVKHLVSEGMKFRLVTFRGQIAAKLATWPNVLEVVSKAYPETEGRLKAQLSDIQRFSFGLIDRKLDLLLKQLQEESEPAVAEAFTNARSRLYAEIFRIFEKQAGFNFLEVQKLGPNDPRYMTLDRYLESSGDLLETRAFLYFGCHLRELFAGDGYTRTPDGQIALQEFIAPNAPLAEIGSYDMQELTL